MNDCRHGAEMCDTCLDIMGDGIKQGAEEECARIITILESECSCDSINPYQEKSCDLCQYIALIKGENK